MYQPVYGKPFRPRKMRTYQMNAQETRTNLRFQRYADGRLFEDNRPDWIRDQEKHVERPDSPSRLGHWELAWIPYNGSADSKYTYVNDEVGDAHGVVVRGTLISSKKPQTNTISSLLSTSVTPLYAPSPAKIGSGLYFGKEIRPSSVDKSIKIGERYRPTSASHPGNDDGVHKRAAVVRPKTASGFRRDASSWDAAGRPSSPVERMSLASSSEVSSSSRLKRSPKGSGKSSSVATAEILERLKALEDALWSEVMMRKKMTTTLQSKLSLGQEFDRTKKQPESDLERTRENIYPYTFNP